ncbi:flagellar hook-basal body complex protein FliE [Phenylobacterium kunshanense]|uniref:Flagellar hook-basal body complex protein FliE n=1 Tax=Phenylobacterium kunshanense TaxID=1445034 RepID=A0A328BB64_9CAUL|nr:flagellar hook-basal body complex protein FliE [Phenylobacterium kunshanense]RAK63701.1 flagellar hook-basal body complex protein FliE [Phenylobacterium kunshanense]
MITPFSAARAYAAIQKGVSLNPGQEAGLDPSIGAGAGPSAPVQGGFGDLVKAAITDAVSSSKHAERQMANQVAGKAELVDVVTAVSAAEASLETVMAVRDQVISAYQEIMRMPI